MAPPPDKPAFPKRQQEQPERSDPGNSPQGVNKAKVQKSLRRSPRLNLSSGEHTEQEASLTARKTVWKANQPTTPQPKGRKRLREVEYLPTDVAIDPSAEPPRVSVATAAAKPANRETQSGNAHTTLDPVDYWRRRHAWPKEYFEPDKMSHLLPRKWPPPSLRRKRSGSDSVGFSSTTPSDQKPREEKSAPYRNARYETLLETKDSFMTEDKQGPKKESKDLCLALLAKDQEVPSISRFSEHVVKLTYQRIQKRNEAKVIQDIARLIVPSAEELADFGAEHLECLVEAVNEGWNNSVPLTGTRPQPDYSVGFKRTTFSEQQRDKLAPFIGDFIAGDQSFFMATYYMYFPFLTCEVKCGAAALDIADRQNTHSMTLAVRAIVELFRLVKREKEIHREILAFSVSHDHRSVRIYGHYAVVDGHTTSFYRHLIHTFDIMALDGKEKWTAYKFTKNVYDVWMPAHFKRLCSAIDDLPLEFDFDVPPFPQGSGLSQDLESHRLSRSIMQSASQTGDDDCHSDVEDITPGTSFTQQGASKRRKGKATK